MVKYTYIEDSNGVGYKLAHKSLKLELIKNFIGEIISYPAITKAPKLLEISGVVLLLCDGSSYNIADYPDLSRKISNTGDTFTLPNLVDNTSRVMASQGTKYRGVELGSKHGVKPIRHNHENSIDVNLSASASAYYKAFNSIGNNSTQEHFQGQSVSRYVREPKFNKTIFANRDSNDENRDYKEKSFCVVPYMLANIK